MFLRYISLTIMVILFTACGGVESALDENSTSKPTSNTEVLDNQPAPIEEEVTVEEDSLAGILSAQARSANSLSEFTLESLKVIVPKVIKDALPKFIEGYALKLDFLSAENLAKNSTIKNYLQSFYEKVTASRQTNAALTTQESELVSQIIAAIKEIIMNWFKSFISGDNNDSNDDDTTNPVDDNYTVDPNAPVGFVIDMLQDKTFYVISSVADMTVNMEADGLSGKGAMGIISMAFTNYIDGNDDIIIDTSLMGQYKIVMNYRDPNYCIATDAVDASGKVYEAYWFTNKSDMKKATSVSSAKSLCYIHSATYEDPNQAVDEGEVITIADTRDNHSPITTTDLTTKEIVENLIADTTNTLTNVIDAKYFARQLRHGALSLYTTNEQPHTLQAQETEKAMRELMPLAASSAIGMQTMMEDASAMGLEFQKELNSDLNATLNDIKARMDALAQATGAAVEQAMDSKEHGSATSSYGDKVDIAMANIDINICLVFFMCQSSAEADVYLKITNNGTNGYHANIEFGTHVEGTSMNLNNIDFSKVDMNPNITNGISSNDYNLVIDDFQYVRNSGDFSINGNGSIKGGQGTQKTEVTLDSYDINAKLRESPAFNFSLNSLSSNLDGSIETAQGRKFDGKLTFDGVNTSSNKLEGTLTGINQEPSLSGDFQTSLTYNDIDVWKNGHDDVTVRKGLPYFIKPDGSLELVESFTNNGWYQSRSFETFNNSYDCDKVSDDEYSCESFQGVKRTIKFLQESEVLLADTSDGEYYIIDVENVGSYSTSEIVLMKKETRKVVSVREFDYEDIGISNLRLKNADLNEPSSINNIGDQSFAMNAKISQGDDFLSADMLMQRDEAKDTWEYIVNNLNASNEFGSVTAKKLHFVQSGDNKIVDKLKEMIVTGMNMSTDINSILNMGWQNLSTMKSLDINDFKIEMQASSGKAVVTNSSSMTSSSDTITANAVMAYEYGTTKADADAKFDVKVTQHSDTNTTYENAFTASGKVSSEEAIDYNYALDYTKEKQYLLLTREDTGYQMGFSMDTSTAKGADSYGVKADFTMNDTFDTLEYMELKTSSNERLGEYQRSSDALKVYFSDESSEYLYVYQ